MFPIWSEIPANCKWKYEYLSSKIYVLSREIWQLSNVCTAFFLATVAYSGAIMRFRPLQGLMMRARGALRPNPVTSLMCGRSISISSLLITLRLWKMPGATHCSTALSRGLENVRKLRSSSTRSSQFCDRPLHQSITRKNWDLYIFTNDFDFSSKVQSILPC